MKNIAILEYSFIFEPSVETWKKGYDFEKDVIDFFASYGLEASLVEVLGGSSKRVMYICKSEEKKEENSKSKKLDRAMEKLGVRKYQ